MDEEEKNAYAVPCRCGVYFAASLYSAYDGGPAVSLHFPAENPAMLSLPCRLAPLAVVWISLAVATSVSSAEQRLADFRRVVIVDEPNGVEKAAAEELANYAGRIVGGKIDVVPASKYTVKDEGLSFFVGTALAELLLGEKFTPWKDEEYLLRTTEKGLVIAGNDGDGDPWSARTSAGSMLAVYTLLDDHLGVRWFWPDAFGEHVPNDPKSVVPELNVRATPAFTIRSFSHGYSQYHTKTFSDAAKKFDRRARLGWVRSAVFGHSWFDAFNLRTDETFKQHPEWFALVDGKRRPPQMCTTNPEVIDRMVEHVLNGKSDIMHISPSDGGGFCECERCRALDVPGLIAYDGKNPQLSDRIFTYANEVARRVREKNPDRGCGMFAYTFYNKPPVRIKKLEPNLYLSFVYQSAAMRDPQNLAEWRESVSGWQKLGAKMVVREGWGNHYYFDLPWPHEKQIIANLAEAHRLGFVAAYGDGTKNYATCAPTYWALTRMLWNPARDPKAVMPEFYRSAYGPVAPQMQAFFETYGRSLDQHWAERERVLPTTGIAYANIIASWRYLIPTSTVDEAEKHLQEAERLAPPGEYAERVAFHRFGQEYTRTMLGLLEAYREASAYEAPIGFPAGLEGKKKDPAARDAALKRAFELGERREQLLLEHRDWSGPDEGLYGFTNDAGLRQWHAAVKKQLGIDKPTAVTKALLKPTP